MIINSLHVAPSLLVLFMIALAVVPLALIWADSRRRDTVQGRLQRLREEASLRDALARRAGQVPALQSHRIIAGE